MQGPYYTVYCCLPSINLVALTDFPIAIRLIKLIRVKGGQFQMRFNEDRKLKSWRYDV